MMFRRLLNRAARLAGRVCGHAVVLLDRIPVKWFLIAAWVSTLMLIFAIWWV